MEYAIKLLDPWQKVLNVPCWRPFMWETILTYGSSYNEKHLSQIELTKFHAEESMPRPLSSISYRPKSEPIVIPCEP